MFDHPMYAAVKAFETQLHKAINGLDEADAPQDVLDALMECYKPVSTARQRALRADYAAGNRGQVKEST